MQYYIILILYKGGEGQAFGAGRECLFEGRERTRVRRGSGHRTAR
jgi:hypothetical protein